MGFRVSGFGFRVRVSGFGFRASGLGSFPPYSITAVSLGILEPLGNVPT